MHGQAKITGQEKISPKAFLAEVSLLIILQKRVTIPID